MNLLRKVFFLTIVSIAGATAAFGQANGSIAGQVTDANGAIIPGATVTAVAADGKQKQAVTNAKGEYSITALAPGKYTLKAIAPTFGLYENTEVVVVAGEKNETFIILTAAALEEKVDVSVGDQVSTDPEANKDATVLKGKDLEALPDDPDELAAALQALAGAAAGPNGGQIYIDGFMGGQLPSKESIREIRINSNPFSAEYDRPGFGRIEILTRPGSDRFRGSFNGSFNDESLNSRNPFAANRAPTQQKRFGGNYSGPIKKGKSSFFFDANHNMVDNNSIINALVLDPSLNIVSFQQDVGVPTRRTGFSPRFDFAINDKNTIVARYNFGRGTTKNQGIGDVSLPSRAFESKNREHELRLTETMIINSKTVNETRFEFNDNRNEQTGDNSIPTIAVSAAFTGGGASIGQNFNHNKTIEVNNFTSTSFGKNMQHSFKFGGRLRWVDVQNRSASNYAGTYSFPGFFGADACDINTDTVVSPLEQYRCKVGGVVGARYNPTQFTINTGTPEIGVSQTEYGLFASNDWKVSPALLLSFGLRYENQTNIDSNLNFAPRFGFAWSPGAGGSRAPRLVIRGGAGVFYERFGQGNTLNALRNNGVNQLSLLVSANDPDPVRRAIAVNLLAQPSFTLSGVTNPLTAAQVLAALPQSASTLRVVAPDLQAPYTMQGAVSVERSFMENRLNFSTTFVSLRTLHTIRQRNINAPVCNTPTDCIGAVRPNPARGNLIAYESSGVVNQNRINVNVRANINQRFSMFGGYNLGFSNSDQDTPAYTYDFTGEYGRSGFDIRHSVNFGGNISLPWGVSLNPMVNFRTGTPFNITRGVDSNGDGFFTERPTFGQLQARCLELNLRTSYCDIGGNPLNEIIPRNYGQGPKSFTANVRIGKNFGFGTSAAERVAANSGGGDNRGGGGGGNRGGGGGPQMVMMGGGGGGGPMRMGGPGGGFGGDNRKPYNLNVGIFVSNLFNNVNLNNPIGSLTSSRFGQSTSTGGGFGGFGGFGGGGANRRIELSMRFNW
jgi:hypothetical protein